MLNLVMLGFLTSQNFYQSSPLIIEDTLMRREQVHRFFKEELQLTQNQQDSFKLSHQHFRQKAEPLVQELDKKRHEMLAEITKQSPDENTMNAIADEIGALHAQLKKQTVQHMLAMRGYCTPEQQAKLGILFQRLIDDKPHKPYNRGNRPRYRQEN